MTEGAGGASSGRRDPKTAGPPKVDCEEAVHQLYHYLDGELTEERRRAIAVHLDLCGSCADAAGFEKELRMVIANCCRDRVPESLKVRIAEAIHVEAHRLPDDEASPVDHTPVP